MRSREARIAVWRAARRSRRAGSGVGVADEDRDDGWTGSGVGVADEDRDDVDVDGVFADGISALEGLIPSRPSRRKGVGYTPAEGARSTAVPNVVGKRMRNKFLQF